MTVRLVVNSESGSGNALSITGHASINTSDYSSVQQIAAQDASFEYNGLTITRESNTVNDLIDGVSLELSQLQIVMCLLVVFLTKPICWISEAIYPRL